MRRHVVVTTVSLVAAALIALAGVAWACTPLPRLVTITPLAAAPGSAVEVRGQAVSADAAVQLRWNAVRGPQLAAAAANANGDFTARFTVPAQAAPGVYTIVAVTEDEGLARAAFQVVGAPGQAPSAPVWQPTLATAQVDPASATDPSFALLAGAGLLTFGTAALFAGAAVAVVGRRRVAAVPERERVG